MAKKSTANQASPTVSADDDRWRVEDGVRTALNYHAMCEDKPLFRKVRKQVTRTARKMSRGGGR